MLHLSPAVTLSQIRVWQQPVHRWPLTTHTNTGASLRPTSSLFYCYLVKHSQLFCSPRPPKPSYRLTERRSEILLLVVIRSLDVVWIRWGKKKSHSRWEMTGFWFQDVSFIWNEKLAHSCSAVETVEILKHQQALKCETFSLCCKLSV